MCLYLTYAVTVYLVRLQRVYGIAVCLSEEYLLLPRGGSLRTMQHTGRGEGKEMVMNGERNREEGNGRYGMRRDEKIGEGTEKRCGRRRNGVRRGEGKKEIAVEGELALEK